MNKEEHIQDLLNDIQHAEGEAFEFDEKGLFGEIQRSHSERSGLATKLLTIAGGFLATSSFLGFIFSAGLYNSDIGLIIFGLGFIGGAIWLNKEFNRLIIDTLSISIYISGFLLLGLGLGHFKMDDHAISITFLVLAVLTMVITQNYIISFISVLIFSGSLLSLIIMDKHFDLIHFYIALVSVLMVSTLLNEAKIVTGGRNISRLYQPLSTGLIFSLLMGLIFIGKRGLVTLSTDYLWISTVVTVPVVFFLISKILKRLEVTSQKDWILVYLLSLLILLPTALAPAISGGLLILLVSFFVKHKTGVVTGIIATTYFVSQYYYDLTFTLLVKSIILFSTGVLFLIFFFIINQHKAR